MRSRMLTVLLVACVVLFVLGTYVIVTAQEGPTYPEGQAPGVTLEASTGEPGAPSAAEGKDPNAVVQSGTLDASQLEQLNRGEITMLGGGVAPLLYQFSGVIENGSATSPTSGTASTSITCTNMSGSGVEVNAIIYGTNALTTYYSLIVTIPAWNTYTFSTHYTALYFDNAIFRSDLSHHGTSPIYQGTGRIFSASTDLICSAQVLDPSGLPPAFMTELELFR